MCWRYLRAFFVRIDSISFGGRSLAVSNIFRAGRGGLMLLKIRLLIVCPVTPFDR